MSILDRALDKYSFLRWHTRRGWRLAFRHHNHWKTCRAGFGAGKDSPPAAATSLIRRGWQVVPPVPGLGDLALEYHSLFDRLIQAGSPDVVSDEGDGLPLIRLLRADVLMPRLHEFLTRGETAEVLTGYYRSRYRIQSAYVYRLIPGASPPSMSWLWHSDDVPPGLIKVMVYLNDTREANGAFRGVDSRLSWRLLRSGFQDRTKAGAFVPTLESKATVFEGPPGTSVIFDNNILHKATAPREGFRDAVVFTVVPSLAVDCEGHWQANLGTLSAEQRPKIPENPAEE